MRFKVKFTEQESSLKVKFDSTHVMIITGGEHKQEKTVTPTVEKQIVLPDAGYTGLSKVIVTAIQTETATLSSNGKYKPTNGKYFSEVTVNVNNAPKLQEKSVTPSESQQEIEADKGYDGLSQVIVERIPDEYIIPEGTINITGNGEYDITDKSKAIVDVNEGYENGYNAGYDVGYAEGEKASYDNGYEAGFSEAGDKVARNFIEGNFPDGFTFPDGVTKVRSFVFYGANFLTDIVLPDSVTKIESYSFAYSSLTSIVGKNVTIINNDAFQNTKNLIFADFPNLAILDDIFGNCGLKSIVLPICRRVYGYAFNFCSKLEVVDLPKCYDITSTAFNNTTALKTLILRNNSVCKLSGTFQNTGISAGTGFVYVPDDLVESYKSATNWSTYASQIKGLSELEE